MKQSLIPFMAVAMMLLTGCEDSDFCLETHNGTSSEADILQCVFTQEHLLKVNTDTVNVTSTTDIEVPVLRSANLTAITPHFVLTPGATIFAQDNNGEWTIPADSLTRDFSNGPLSYLVVSANGKSHHLYHLMLNNKFIPKEFNFSHFALNDSTVRTPYYVWKEYDTDGEYLLSWATGNPGFAISRSSAKPDDFPTVPCEGYKGAYGVKLETRSTGSFGQMVNMRLAAGNIFLGEFDVSNALKDACASTHFGVPYGQQPLALKGMMAYQPGNQFQDPKGNIIAEGKDSCDIYAVLYKNTDADGKPFVLDGYCAQTSEQIVALARLDDQLAAGTNGEWTAFEAKFNYNKPTPFNVNTLHSFGYNLTIVASSSRGGAKFYGAVGSTLRISNLQVVTKDEVINE